MIFPHGDKNSLAILGIPNPIPQNLKALKALEALEALGFPTVAVDAMSFGNNGGKLLEGLSLPMWRGNIYELLGLSRAAQRELAIFHQRFAK